MDINQLLVWMICLSCSFFLLRVFQSSPRNHWGWIVVCGSIFSITLGTFLINAAIAALVGGILWGFFFLLPLLGIAQVNRLFYQQRYHQARQLATYVAWLHPADGWLEQASFLHALEMAQLGQLTEAANLLQRRSPSTNRTLNPDILIYWIEADWQGCRKWFQKNVPTHHLFQNPGLLVYYLRSLGETGDLVTLVNTFKKAEKALGNIGDPLKENLLSMFVLAFCGQTQSVHKLFQGPLSVYGDNIHKFWVATAQMAAGHHNIARRNFSQLSQGEDQILQNAIYWRLAHPPKSPSQVLTPQDWKIVDRLKQRLNQDQNARKIFILNHKKAYGTYLLIALNLCMFALEIHFGGSENHNTLYFLGAVTSPEIMGDQWWRLISANFLHFGWVHLLSNLMSLYLLGLLVEWQLGTPRFLFTYLVTGVGTMFLFTQFTQNNYILVGASAAIMGLLGVILSRVLQKWRQEKSRIATKRLRMTLLIIGLQFIFDISIPEVSFLSHFIGLILGFLIDYLFLKKQTS